MAGRQYTVVFDNVPVTVASDFFELNPAADKPIQLIGLDIGQTNRVGDANEDLLRWSILRLSGGTLTSGSGGGTPPTPQPLNPTDAAAGFTAEINNTTQASTTGTTSTLWASTFNTRIGLLWTPTPEQYAMAVDSTATGILVVRLLEAPGASTTFTGTAVVQELG
jgi:hypothetical protein